MEPQFKDETVTIDSVFGSLSVTVTGDALHVLWGADSGPQDGPGLIAYHREMIEQVATMKFEAGESEDSQAVRITGPDLE